MYNDFEGLKKSVEEIKRQKHKCEVIIKDGSNCTRSRHYIKNSDTEYAKLKYINTSDIGIYDAINQAKDYISGTHIWVIGCGDIPHFEAIKKLQLIEQTVYIAPVLLCDGSDKYIYKGRLTPSHQGIIYCSEIYQKLNYDTGYTIISDRIFYDQFKRNFSFPIVHIDEPICTFAMDGISSQNSSKVLIFKEMLRYFQTQTNWRNFLRLLSSLKTYIWYVVKT